MDEHYELGFYKKLRNFGASASSYEKGLKFHKARIRRDMAMEAYDWCQSALKNDWIWSSPDHTFYTDIYFKKKEDALLFKLKFKTY